MPLVTLPAPAFRSSDHAVGKGHNNKNETGNEIIDECGSGRFAP